MARLRTGRQRYYNIFSRFYDDFIALHASGDRDETRRFLVDAADLQNAVRPRVLDICCGTGSVILSFADRIDDILAIGYDFSIGMLARAKAKNVGHKADFIKGNAASLPFGDNAFDIVCCSHALYELKGRDRYRALSEMKRVVKPDGKVLIMEHAVPRKKLIRLLFYVRMLTLGSQDAREFLGQGNAAFKSIFPNVLLTHTASGKSKLFICDKHRDG